MKKPLIMGILNVTPDSFFDGGKTADPFVRASKLIEEGADIIDIGGESTRPGAEPVSFEDEKKRVIPVLKQIKAAYPKITISIDTYKPKIAKLAVEEGADIINDPSGLADPVMADIAASSDTKLVVMHTRGTPQNMDKLTEYADIVADIKNFFEKKIQECAREGLHTDNIILDPGFGFAKNKEQNFLLLKNISYYKSLGLPLLIGLSRKKFLAKEGDTPADRLEATLSANLYAAMNGADILRVHDVAETIKILEKIPVS
ncbi:Dihydropteroate synthase [Elusimicrobium minutum Pei191]|uniref:Dihydropteroate synthase n=1 Tax=Elusimicrobium minutum (strain Pei191) TaxID=445932 RepID=B2KC61_ELUMP|nr:dihydropteroate synthase [Elusimicrobium minutum]ACC98188.1 Dihydropteroate synthase [Elusimicrobium minutum Pei191]